VSTIKLRTANLLKKLVKNTQTQQKCSDTTADQGGDWSAIEVKWPMVNYKFVLCSLTAAS